MSYRRHSLVMVLLMAGCVIGYLTWYGWIGASLAAAQTAAGPSLSIAQDIKGASPGAVTVPIRFERGQSGVTALAFSIFYDPTCLTLAVGAEADATQAVTFRAPPQFRGSVLVDLDDTDGIVNIALADYAPPLSTLPDLDSLADVTFDILCQPTEGETITTTVGFGAEAPASFSNTLGRAVEGSVSSGAVLITRAQPTPPPGPTPTPDPNVTPAPVNTAPTAGDDVAGTSEFRAVKIDVLANDVDPDGDPLVITEITPGGMGQATIQADGTVLYVPEPGRNGTDLFSYTIDDGHGGLSAAFVQVTVSPFNIPPVAQDDLIQTDRDLPTTIDVLANDSDADPVEGAAPLMVFVVGQPSHGITHLNLDNTITYTPTAGYAGEDMFRYTVVDGEGGSGVASVHVTVRAVNRPPEIDLATDTLNYATGRDVTLQILATDPDGDKLTFAATGLPPGLSIDPHTGSINGVVVPGTQGEFSVRVVVSDGQSSAAIEFGLLITPATLVRHRRYVPVVVQ